MRGLDRKIDIERFTATEDVYGQPVESWEKVATRLWANVRPLSGTERYTAQQFAALQQTEFRIRWSQDVKDITPLDRVVYPADTDTPDEGEIYDIIAVNELGRREALQIIGARRAEAQIVE